MCTDSRPQQVRADLKRSRAPMPQASDKADNCWFSKSPTLSPRHSQRLVSMALVADKNLRNTAMSGRHTESTHDFAASVIFYLSCSMVLYHFICSKACMWSLIHLDFWGADVPGQLWDQDQSFFICYVVLVTYILFLLEPQMTKYKYKSYDEFYWPVIIH